MRTSRHDSARWRTEVDIVDDVYARDSFEMPVHAILSLTNACNLHCPFCFLRKIEGQQAMTTGDWLDLIEQLPRYSRVILFGGEPLLFDGFARVFMAAAATHDCSIVTNGTLLTSAVAQLLVSRVRFRDLNVSIDSLGNWNRNFSQSDWEAMLAGVDAYNDLRAGSQKQLGVSVVLLDETAEELHELHRFAHERLRCDFVNYCLLNGSPMQLCDVMRPYEAVHERAVPPLYAKWDMLLDQLDRNRRYDREHGFVSYFRPKLIDFNGDEPTERLRSLNCDAFDRQQFGPCKMPWADCRIHPDGDVSACLSVPFGNFKEHRDLRAILDGPVARRFRRELRQEGLFAQCNRCVFLYDKSLEHGTVGEATP